MYSRLGLNSIQPLVQRIAAAIASTFQAAVEIVDQDGKAVGESRCSRVRDELLKRSNGRKQAAIILNDRYLGEIKVNPGGTSELAEAEVKQYLHYLSSLLAAKVAAAQAEAQVENLTAILEVIEEGALLINEAGTVDYGNSAAAGLLGLKRRDLATLPLEKFWPALASFENLLNGQESASGEVSYCRGDRRVNLIVTAHRVKAEQGGSRVFFLKDPVKESHPGGHDSGSRHRFTFTDIIGRSEVIDQVKERAVRVAAGNSTVLITGESGTGKDVFAQAIHYSSPRFRGPFVSVNCGAIPENLLESELFGYEKGAFTGALKEGKAGKFELADRGTILLDEIGEMPPHLQVKLLHVLQNREVERVGGTRKVPVDIRIIAASNRDLDKMMEEKKFRKDLYFRLGVIPLYIPPLRERKEDIPLFVESCLDRYAKSLNKPSVTVSPEVMEKFLRYRWPGNVRELENAIEYAINMCRGHTIRMADLPPRIFGDSGEALDDHSTLKSLMQEHERHIFEQYLRRFGSSSKAKDEIAQVLGISRATLYRKLADLGIK